MGIDESLVKEIVRRILAAAAPDKIILFGSAATGEMPRDSDIRRGKRTEIQAMNGAIVDLGRQHGIATPVNQTLERLILFREADRNGLRGGIGLMPPD